MPELPEVETIKRGLSAKIIGKKIVSIENDTKKSFQGNHNDVIGAKITAVDRLAKMVLVKLSNDLNLAFHLKMTGQLIYQKQLTTNNQRLTTDFAGGHPDHEWHNPQPGKHTRIIFTFDDNSKLFFNDLRRFGWCKVLTPQAIEALDKEYGLDPFDKKFTVDYLLLKAKKIPSRKIKQFLTDQTIIAGIGNIYADETLFDAGIMPTRKIKDIKLSEWKKIIASILKILKLAIEYGGTTDSDYVNVDGKKGGMQDHLNVYHRTGQPCPVSCGGVVKRITIGGRGTHYCPACQR